MIDLLIYVYQKSGNATMNVTVWAMQIMIHNNWEEMQCHVSEFDRLVSQLKFLGHSILSPILAQNTLNTLPEMWTSVISSFNVLGTFKEFTLEEVKVALFTEEAFQKL